MSKDDSAQFKKNSGLKALIQKENKKNIIDPSEITLIDLIKVFGEEPVRRGLQYMASLEKANEHHKNATSNDLLKGLKEWADSDELTNDMIKMSDEWSKQMKEKGIGID